MNFLLCASWSSPGKHGVLAPHIGQNTTYKSQFSENDCPKQTTSDTFRPLDTRAGSSRRGRFTLMAHSVGLVRTLKARSRLQVVNGSALLCYLLAYLTCLFLGVKI